MLLHSLAGGIVAEYWQARAAKRFRPTFSPTQLTLPASIHINPDECQFIDSNRTIRVRVLIRTPRKIDGVYVNYSIVSF